MESRNNIENGDEEKVLNSIKTSRIVIPLLLGIGVILLLVWKQFDIDEFNKINWGGRVLYFTLLAIFTYLVRHLVLSYRLKVLSNDHFSLAKSTELITIWEFASAVSPTSIGGSAVSLFLLAQEKLSAAKTVALVVYSIVADSIFFIVSLPILYFMLGPESIRPDASSFSDLGGYGLTFILVYIFIVLYGALFTFGILQPRLIKGIIKSIAKIPFLKRFEASINKTAEDIIISSKEITAQPFGFHFKVFVTTFIAWVLRFFAITLVIMALVSGIEFSNGHDQLLLYARSEIMHSITQFSPTPGGAGVTELLFGGFYSDYISSGISSLVALLWRLVTYYPYLIIGAFIIPNWIRKIWIRRRQDRTTEVS